MSDGQQTLNSAVVGTSNTYAMVFTDGTGNINGWFLILFVGNAAGSVIVSAGGVGQSPEDAGALVDTFNPPDYDLAGNETMSGTWTVGATPAALTMNLITTVQSMQIPQQGASLVSQLQTVASDISANNGQACQDLNAFENHVAAQTNKKITQSQANTIQAAASAISTARRGTVSSRKSLTPRRGGRCALGYGKFSAISIILCEIVATSSLEEFVRTMAVTCREGTRIMCVR
jgi:hypothetical protein